MIMRAFVHSVNICVCSLLFLQFSQATVESFENNVCSTFRDYSFINNNKNCWYNPDVDATPESIAENHGFKLEKHTVKTKDNYLLTLFRIPSSSKNVDNHPILIHHGFVSNALFFMLSGNRSFAFFLAENGFDVWLANIRGSAFSSGHSKYNLFDPEYWNFSFHESAVYDIPTYVRYITNLTNPQNKITYVGHSMGTTIAFIYASLKKENAEKYINGFILVAPVAAFTQISSFSKAMLPAISKLIEDLKKDKIVALFPNAVLGKIIWDVCKNTQILGLCNQVLSLFIGPDNNELAPEDMRLLINSHPSRSSLKTVEHFFQYLKTGRFRQFDYGQQGNMLAYNRTTPPEYPIDKITVPVHLYYGANDLVTPQKDVEIIYKNLTTKDKTLNLVPKNEKIKYNHAHFFLGKHAVQYFYKPLLKDIRCLQNITNP